MYCLDEIIIKYIESTPSLLERKKGKSALLNRLSEDPKVKMKSQGIDK